jgi:hypothetical protein
MRPLAAEALLQPQEEAWAQLRDAWSEADPAGRAQLTGLVASHDWRDQLLGAAALVVGGADAAQAAALWQAVDGASWAAPQLVAAAFLVDEQFGAQAETRLCDVVRRPPKTIGALVRAYHRLPAPSLPVVAQLGRHDRVMASEEARIGVRGVDGWLDRLPMLCRDEEQARWRRMAR